MRWDKFKTVLLLQPSDEAPLHVCLNRYRRAYADLWSAPPAGGGGKSRLELIAESMLREAALDFGYGQESFEANLNRLEGAGATAERVPLTTAFQGHRDALQRGVRNTLGGVRWQLLSQLGVDVARFETDSDPLKDALTTVMANKLVDEGHSGTFCVLPWIHTFIDVNGDVKLCCEAETPTQKNPNLRGRSLGEIWNSKSLIDVRTRMISGQTSEACRRCHKEDALGQTSSRQFYNDYWLHFDRDRERWKSTVKQSLGTGLQVQTLPAYYDIRPGNLCTLKCRMCHSDYSNLIQADPVHSEWAYQSPEMRADRVGDGVKWYDATSGFADELLENIAGTRRFYMAGGEPLVNPFIARLIEALVTRGIAPNISLEISSNMTTFPEKLLGQLLQFESVQMAVSLDGTDELYQYIRYPGKWPRIAGHVKSLAAKTGIEAMVTTTVQNYNALDVHKVFEFALSLGLPCNLNIVYTPPYLSMGVMPQAAKDEAIARLTKLKAIAVRSTVGRGHPAMMQRLENVITELKLDTRDAYRELVGKFLEFTTALDKSRGQDFASVCPDLHRYLEEDGVLLESLTK